MNKQIVIAALVALISSRCVAADGAYNLVGIGFSPLTDRSNTTYGFGVSLGGGYNFNKYFGIETQIGALGIGSDTTISVMPLPAITLNGYFPVREGVNLYGKIGKSDTTVTFGSGGTQTNYSGITNTYGVGVEFSSTDKNTYRIGADHYSLGIVPGGSLSANYINLMSTTHF